MQELLTHHYKKKVKSIEKDNAYIQFIIDLSSYIPVEYIENGPIEGVQDTIINKIVSSHKAFNFKVDLDGIYLKKPIFFPKKNPARKDDKYIIKTFEKSINIDDKRIIKFFGYFYAWNELLVPREFNGVVIRIKNIPIAERFGFDTTFLGYPSYTDQLFRNWITGEIYVQEGLEDAMNIDRKSFRKTHPEYLAIQNWVHEFLRNEIFAKLVKGLYDKGKEKREKDKESKSKSIQRKMLNAKKISLEITSTINTKPTQKTSKHLEIHAPLSISKKDNSEVIIKINQNVKKKYKMDEWRIIENVFIIFETAFKECKGDVNKLRKLFYSKMNELNELKRKKK